MQRTLHHAPQGEGGTPREAGADAVWAGAWPSLPGRGRRTCVWDNRESLRPHSARGGPGGSGGRRVRNEPCAAMCGRCGWFALGCRPGVSPRVPQSWARTFWAWSRHVSCRGLLLQLESLRASYAALKAQSQEEIRRLWSQLESPGRDSQDPSGEASAVQSSGPRKRTRRLHGRDSCCTDSGRRVVFRRKPEGLGFTVGPACGGWGQRRGGAHLP